MEYKKKYHALEIEQVISSLGSGEHGMSSAEAKKRLLENGYNELPKVKKQSILSIFLSQFKSPLIYILLAAGLIVVYLEEYSDAIFIFIVLLFNSVIGSVQEGRAQNVFLALKKFIKGHASVLRDGKEISINDRELVVGDVIILREGEKVPADARIIYANSLKIDEAAITGESLPKFKSEETSKKDISVMNQENMIFKGTVVVSGNGKAIVVATGTQTFLGNIAEETLGIDSEFPLKSSMKKISRFVIFLVILISVIFLVLGLNWGYSFVDIFKTIVALAVSVIPAGLPVVITIVLASGLWRMGKKNVLVKKLQAVEVLGETEILAVDKTGTVTKNELVVEKALIGDREFEVGGIGYDPQGEIRLEGSSVSPLNHPELLLSGKVAALGSSANLIFKKKPKGWFITGDPTDGAMTVFANKLGFLRADMLGEMPLISELPFDYKVKYHASLHKEGEKNFLAMAGSPEVVLALCSSQWFLGGEKKIDSRRKKELLEKFLNMSQQGLRVIALAYAETTHSYIDATKMPPLVFVGFLGIKDALRREVRQAVKKVEASGVKVVMITGDYKVTAEAIAKEAGIYKSKDEIISGEEIEKMSENELAEKIKKASVFSRVTPDHKLKIIQAYKLNKTVVAMTGDGVNDTLSLAAADIGISMGKIGTDVAKEASDLILLDDNFGNIAHGVEEGRRIFKTIKKVILYLFSTSLGEVITILGALLIGLPLPLLAAHILWLNLVTDGFLDVGLAMEPEGKIARAKNYFKRKNHILDRLMFKRMVIMALPMAIGTIFLFSQNYQTDLTKAWTISLTTLAVFQWFNVWSCRSEEKSIFSLNPFSNKLLLVMTFVVVSLQILAVYNPFMQRALKTAPLDFSDWTIILAVASSVIFGEEIRKFFYRRKISRSR
jgi:P-type Ca2+ transporter type 2C